MALPVTSPLIKQPWIRAVVFFIVYLLLSLAVFFAASGIWASRHPGSTTPALLADPDFTRVTLVAESLLIIAATLLFRRFIDRQPMVSLGLQWKGFQRQAGIGIALAWALLGIGSLVLYVTGHVQWTGTNWDTGAFFMGLCFFILTAFEEEILFRGYLLNNLLDSLNQWVALIITTVLFALVHLGNLHINGLAIVNLLLGGVVLGLNYVYTRNLWFSILFHIGWNFFQGGVLGYEVSGLGVQSLFQMDRMGNELLTGGAFGFEGSFIATVLLLMASLLLLRRDWWSREAEGQ